MGYKTVRKVSQKIPRHFAVSAVGVPEGLVAVVGPGGGREDRVGPVPVLLEHAPPVLGPLVHEHAACSGRKGVRARRGLYRYVGLVEWLRVAVLVRWIM